MGVGKGLRLECVNPNNINALGLIHYKWSVTIKFHSRTTRLRVKSQPLRVSDRTVAALFFTETFSSLGDTLE